MDETSDTATERIARHTIAYAAWRVREGWRSRTPRNVSDDNDDDGSAPMARSDEKWLRSMECELVRERKPVLKVLLIFISMTGLLPCADRLCSPLI